MTQAPSNSRTLFGLFSALQWLALPILVLEFGSVWQKLPERMATHFDLAGQPNGWMAREEAVLVMLGISAAVLIIATWIASRVKEADATAWGLIAVFYIIQGTLIYAAQSMIDFNLHATPVHPGPVLLVGIVSAVLLIVFSLSTRRGEHLPTGRVYATETHASVLWAAVCGAPLIVFIPIVTMAPIPALKVALGLAALIGVWAASMAAFGFQYTFSSSGVDIRTLGFRLRSIAASDIRSYAEDNWPFWGGRGIRGLGNRRAYVWGNRGVRIQTNTGEVFLGHNEPRRIVRDLDRVVQNHEGHEGTRRQ
ncbi:MAG TPA: DUF1648 domain-containing protein [Terriglobales bacterium]|nr:DUF1648 domain-containing protein [Terriglobales bacterium]